MPPKSRKRAARQPVWFTLAYTKEFIRETNVRDMYFDWDREKVIIRVASYVPEGYVEGLRMKLRGDFPDYDRNDVVIEKYKKGGLEVEVAEMATADEFIVSFAQGCVLALLLIILFRNL